MKVQRVSNGVKENVEDVLNGKFDKRIYNLMNDEDKRLVKRFAKCVKSLRKCLQENHFS